MAAPGGVPEGSPVVGRLRRRAEFLAAASGARSHGALLTLQMRRRGDQDGPRLGITVTKRVGTAVERNRIRRRLRAAVAAVASAAARPGNDYVIVARRGLLAAGFPHLLAELAQAFRRVHGRSGAATNRAAAH